MPELQPSIASAPALHLARCLDQVRDWGVLHVDLEDGNFVPNITFGIKTLKSIAAYTDLRLSVHIMASRPMDYVLPALELPSVREIIVHFEGLPYPLEALHKIRAAGKKAGLAFNFTTPVEHLATFAQDLDLAMIMCAEPDGRGQNFHSACLPRIQRARLLLGPDCPLWADGGIAEEGSLRQVLKAGASHIVMGRAVWDTGVPMENLMKFQKVLREFSL